SMSQAIMEYAQPLMETNPADISELNRKMELASSLWNLATSKQKNNADEYAGWMKKVRTDVRSVLSLDGEEMDRFIEEMVQRHIYLFPEEIQPAPPSMFMYMRKDASYLIRPFDHSRIGFKVEKSIDPDEEDQRFIEKIRELDDHMQKGTNYDVYERLAISIEEESAPLFKKWLIAKGFNDDPEEYIHCVDIYMTFIYRYMLDDLILLKSVPDEYLMEFFEDYLLRKVMCKPFEYLYWPPSLKLFYRFLGEKGYTSPLQTATMIEALDAIEPHFLEILQERYQ
ncbi:MAG TPA: hypothetical protein PLB81_12720, partial [Deltaproteobacteria bacterium]|nr:hypothetical protein [Deltaproteobacteria bacterium]